MNNLTDIKNIKSILNQFDFNFSKKLGQNFLIDPSVCPKMAEAAVVSDNTGVIEIGPGIGVLTKELALYAKKIIAVELDSALLPVLNKTLSDFDNIKIIHDDILKIDLTELIKSNFDSNMDIVICANLPYYITSPIIMKLLESKIKFNNLTLMVQKEAAVRLCASPGTRDCGAISIAVNYYTSPEILFLVSRNSFIPSPKVDSAVIKLNLKDSLPLMPEDETKFFKIVKASFSQRRKNLSNSLSSGLSIPKNNAIILLNSAKIDINKRAEQLSFDDFLNLARIF